MSARDHCLACLNAEQPALFEAALWVAAEHDVTLQPRQVVDELGGLKHQVDAGLPNLPPQELAQPLLRSLNDLHFHEDDDNPVRPQAALLHKVLQRRRGQPLSIALIALELARRLEIPLQGVNFPGYFLLRVPGADHLLDPCGGRRLYTRDCRELLLRHMVPQAQLSAEHMLACDARDMIVRLSRNLRHLHVQEEDYLSALKDAERCLQLTPPNVGDHLARADLYQRLDCPQAERFDIQRALLLCNDPALHLRLSDRLRRLGTRSALH
ncbi:Regulator of sirC expression, contains transglutaminase-like and TPR domains [Pseudomonas flavescens]|uniref:Regulator of sirC expression, contains transglutaminase-like and TPR domains n=1 Tax=Phytopseudomonas flavescens TaxID=29435 RepID=A0A1G8GLL8_9GAMM|nr:transglutaminase family protein [Pseudomonas flavescens]SDH95200.1 Regulator of sirC expression, contains transglutaminase-like and TPR domains [Pseudomonas flavescens]